MHNERYNLCREELWGDERRSEEVSGSWVSTEAVFIEVRTMNIWWRYVICSHSVDTLHPSHGKHGWAEDFKILLLEGLAISTEGKKQPIYMQMSLKEQEGEFVTNIQNVINSKIIGEGLNTWQFSVTIENSCDGEGSIIWQNIFGKYKHTRSCRKYWAANIFLLTKW